MQKFFAGLARWFERADARSRGVLGYLRFTLTRMSAVHAPEAAASLAYYAIFTLFPLLLLVVAFSSRFLRSDVVLEAVVEWVDRLFPVGRDLISESIGVLLSQRTSVGVLGLIALFWSASGFFAVLVLHINRAFPGGRPSNIVRHRLLGLLMVLVVLVAFVASLVVSGMAGVIRSSAVLSRIRGDVPLRWSTPLLLWIMTFLLFSALYRWVPTRRATWRATIVGALVAATAWQIGATAFSYVVSHGLVRYELIYGTLAAFVALLFWIYMSCWIILFGAHLAGALDAR
jgi:membrane protein